MIPSAVPVAFAPLELLASCGTTRESTDRYGREVPPGLLSPMQSAWASALATVLPQQVLRSPLDPFGQPLTIVFPFLQLRAERLTVALYDQPSVQPDFELAIKS